MPDLERRERACAGDPVPRAFIWRLMGEYQENIHQLSRWASLVVSTDWSVPGGHYSLPLVLTSAMESLPSDFGASLGLEQKHNWSLAVTFQGLMLKGVVMQGLWFCPLLGTRSLHPGDPLPLAHHSCPTHACLTPHYKNHHVAVPASLGFSQQHYPQPSSMIVSQYVSWSYPCSFHPMI